MITEFATRRVRVGFIAAFLAASSASVSTGAPPSSISQPMGLRVKVVKAFPRPVIDAKTPGTERIAGGFECGNTVKVNIAGHREYHMFTLRMPQLGWQDLGSEHWASRDGFSWRRIGPLTDMIFDKKMGKYIQSVPPLPFYDEGTKRWAIYYCRFECKTVSWQSGATLWHAASEKEGIEGIDGPYNFPGTQIVFPGTGYPKESIAESLSSPFRAKNGQWAVLVGGNGPPYQEQYGRYWVVVATAPRPHGPFTLDAAHSPATMVNPIGWVENPVVTKVRGRRSGQDYWVAVFDFLAPECVNYKPSTVFGFTWSDDGLNWPMDHGQIVNINDGLAPGETGWWKGQWAVRTVHQPIEEEDGTYTCFFTGASTPNYFAGFRNVGRLKLELIEEPMPQSTLRAPPEVQQHR